MNCLLLRYSGYLVLQQRNREMLRGVLVHSNTAASPAGNLAIRTADWSVLQGLLSSVKMHKNQFENVQLRNCKFKYTLICYKIYCKHQLHTHFHFYQRDFRHILFSVVHDAQNEYWFINYLFLSTQIYSSINTKCFREFNMRH